MCGERKIYMVTRRTVQLDLREDQTCEIDQYHLTLPPPPL